MVTVKVGASLARCHSHATRWLRVWLDAHLTVGEHRAGAREWEECGDSAAPARRPAGALFGNLPKGHDGMHRVGRYVRMSAVVERGPDSWLNWPPKRVAAASQPASARDYGMLTDINLGSLSLDSRLRPAVAQLDNKQRVRAAPPKLAALTPC